MKENNRKEYQRLYYLKNKERLLKKNKDYYRNHKHLFYNNTNNTSDKLKIKRGPIIVSFD